jgi:hypothetical protein
VLGDLCHVGDEVRVSQHHTLGKTSRAAGIGQSNNLLLRVDTRLGVSLSLAIVSKEKFAVLLGSKDEDLLDIRILGRSLHSLEERSHRDNKLGIAVAELVSQLISMVERVGGSVDTAKTRDGGENDLILRAVGKVNGHAVTTLEAEFLQVVLQCADTGLHLGVRYRATARSIDRCRLVPPLVDVLCQILRYRHVWNIKRVRRAERKHLATHKALADGAAREHANRLHSSAMRRAVPP